VESGQHPGHQHLDVRSITAWVEPPSNDADDRDFSPPTLCSERQQVRSGSGQGAGLDADDPERAEQAVRVLQRAMSWMVTDFMDTIPAMTGSASASLPRVSRSAVVAAFVAGCRSDR